MMYMHLYSTGNVITDLYFMNTLLYVCEWYHVMCRNLRNLYKWSPSECDSLPMKRFIRITQEAEEDKPEDSNWFNYG